MKKLYFRVRDLITGSNLVKYGQVAVRVTDKVLQVGDSATATTILMSLSLNDEYARVKVVLERLLPEFKAMQTVDGRKAIAKRIAVEIIQALDSNASGRMELYSAVIEMLLKGK